ncbi:MAG: exodeoxyribonuclease VII large subunit [Bacteroidales bacterium]|nr:exodeoxyribonuclease VII large subunit [Bacteroidales bacterium]
MHDSALTLIELNQQIKSAIEKRFDSPVWLIAEINSINRHRSGHCYLEFVQKAKNYDQIIAKTRATIWSAQYRMIDSYFQSVTKSSLEAGLKVLVKVSVDYHEQFGLSLNVRDIDPAYTLGDLERRRKEIIDKLKAEGVFDMNKNLELPTVIRKIALISSSGAAGYEDFINHLENNKYGYKFEVSLFEADMQGNRTEQTVTKAINDVFESGVDFDILAILRGGGSKSDLSFFDNYNIAYLITQFPIPVITGIGHERDESVCDMVAHTPVKTPTAVANLIIEHNLFFESQITEIGESIFVLAKDIIQTNSIYLTNLSLSINKTKNILVKKQDYYNQLFYKIYNTAKNKIRYQQNIINTSQSRISNTSKISIRHADNRITNYKTRLTGSTHVIINKNLQKIEMLEQNIRLVDPINVLHRGFSITRHQGKIINKKTKLSIGDEIETLIDGKTLKSTIKNKNEE